MSQSAALANRLREVILDGTWIANTNFRDQLSDVDLELASTKSGSRHSIAELTFHIHYYLAGVLQVLEGGSLDIRDQHSFEMPKISTEDAWEQRKDDLYRDAEKLATAVEQLADEQLTTCFVDPKYGDYRRNLEGVIEHSYYHLGQLVLIKKLILEARC